MRMQPVMIVLLLLSGPPLFLIPMSSAKPASLPEVEHPIVYRPASLSTPGTPPFAPSDIRKAYDFLPIYSRGVEGNGTRIAVIDAFGDPTLSTDVSKFDTLTGLPSATVNTFYPDGVPRRANSGWALETALDVEWAHAIAPSATIDVVVALDSSLSHIFDGISFVATSLTSETALSMSFGLSESSYPTTGSFTIAATHQLFVTISSHGTSAFASSGDSGANSCCNAQYPASDPLVVAVGGTGLTLKSDASYSGEYAWSGSGAGASIVFSKPSWQQGLGDSMRDIADVSYDADPNTGVLVVQGGLDFQVGGTSAGSPQWAALAALTSQTASTRYGSLSPRLYKISSYHDITTGNDGFFPATVGWDYPTGLGTPDAAMLISSLTQPPIPIHGTKIFQGLNTTTTGSLTVNVFNSTLSGTATVEATNSTSGRLVFARNYTIANVQLQNNTVTRMTRFLLDIPVSPYSLSANIALTVQGTTITSQVDVTRDINISGTGTVNITDVGVVTLDYGRTLGSPLYNPRADLVADGTVDLVDVGLVFLYFGATVFS